MSQQINLYEARLRPRETLLTGRRLALALAVLLVLLGGFAAVSRRQADQSMAEMIRLQSEVKTWQEKHDALAKQIMDRQIPASLQNELDRANTMLSMRAEVVSVLDSGRLGNTEGFSALFYGFSRYATSDWWLTGFSVSLGGQEIEIRGKLLDAAKLPGYVQRLSQDAAFQGRNFATLTMNSVDPSDAKPDAVPAAKGDDKPELRLPRHVDFILRTENAVAAAKPAGGGK